MKINGQSMDLDRIDETIEVNDTEIWEIINKSEMPHPFHVHDIQFLILTRDGSPPPDNEAGWKDTVLVMPGKTVRIIARFSDFVDPVNPYMFHCHILEHEDAGMMGQFVVV
jgi:FtsP/CotA-like multicopper oxidase with cupredoxin domain